MTGEAVIHRLEPLARQASTFQRELGKPEDCGRALGAGLLKGTRRQSRRIGPPGTQNLRCSTGLTPRGRFTHLLAASMFCRNGCDTSKKVQMHGGGLTRIGCTSYLAQCTSGKAMRRRSEPEQPAQPAQATPGFPGHRRMWKWATRHQQGRRPSARPAPACERSPLAESQRTRGGKKERGSARKGPAGPKGALVHQVRKQTVRQQNLHEHRCLVWLRGKGRA